MTVMKICKFFCGMILGLMLLVTANPAEATNPQGYFDFVQSDMPNQIRVRGWAFDRDNVNHKVRIHVYVGGSVGANVPSYEIRADQFRPDVNRAFPGVGDYHGFDSTINVDTSRTGNQAIYIYALNDVGSGTFVELGSKPVSIKAASTNRVTNHNPQGRVIQIDSPSNNTLHVKGTAWDDDNPNGTVRVHVYVGGTPGSNVPQYEIRADRANHEFEDTRNIGNSKTGNQTVHVYALNDYGPGTFQEIWTGNVNIKGANSLQNLVSEWNGQKWDNRERGTIGSECFGFANYIFRKLHGVQAGVTQNGAQLGSLSSGVTHLFLTYDASIDRNAVHDTFRTKAKSGDFIISSRPHSMIFDRYDANTQTVWLFDANWVDRKKRPDLYNLIQYRSMSLNDFINAYRQFSIYTK